MANESAQQVVSEQLQKEHRMICDEDFAGNLTDAPCVFELADERLNAGTTIVLERNLGWVDERVIGEKDLRSPVFVIPQKSKLTAGVVTRSPCDHSHVQVSADPARSQKGDLGYLRNGMPMGINVHRSPTPVQGDRVAEFLVHLRR